MDDFTLSQAREELYAAGEDEILSAEVAVLSDEVAASFGGTFKRADGAGGGPFEAEGALDRAVDGLPEAKDGLPEAAAVQGAGTLPEASAFVEGTVGLGVDIVDVERMARILERSPSFAARAFADDERAYCEAAANPAAHFAVRFAAKEAVAKALGTGFAQGVGVRDIEVRRTANGRPYVALSGEAKRIAAERGVRELPLSLSYTRSDAVACVMAITESSVRASAERVDPLQELAKQFKETRSFLDEI